MYKKIFIVLIICMLVAMPTGIASARGNEPLPPTPGGDGQTSQYMAAYAIPFSYSQNAPMGATTGCNTRTDGIDMYSLVGLHLWRYAWNIQWCYNGSTITSLSKWRTVLVYVPGWSFLGDIYETSDGGVGRGWYRHFAQGDMCFIQFYTCVQHVYPWVDQTVWGNGGSIGNASY
jgi:hypothetical protein